MRAVRDPIAIARVRWRSPDGGGRTKPPPGPSFAATAVFKHGGDEEVVPEWPAGGEHFSVLLEYPSGSNAEVTARVDFLARNLVADEVREGAQFIIMEGPRPVADAEIVKAFPDRLKATR